MHRNSIVTYRNISTHLKYKLDNIIYMFNPFLCEVNIDTKEAKSSCTRSSTTHKTVAPTLRSQHRQQASWALMTKQVAQVMTWLQEHKWDDNKLIMTVTFKTYLNSKQNNLIQSYTNVCNFKSLWPQKTIKPHTKTKYRSYTK